VSDPNPFLGARPYGPADDPMFFGRATDAAVLKEQICLRPLTIVTAPSGVGKTSLLRAAVLPGLERDGFRPLYCRPDPGASGDATFSLLGGRLAEMLVQGFLPDLELESSAIGSVTKVLSGATSLAAARAWFAELSPMHYMRSTLLAPAERSSEWPIEQESLLARYLRGTMTIQALAADYVALGCSHPVAINDASLLRDIAQSLRAPEAEHTIDRMRQLARGTQSPAEAENVVRFLAGMVVSKSGETASRSWRLSRADGESDLALRLVLVIDQFEQVFTQAAAHSRETAMRLLLALLRPNLPVHLVVSLRKEWFSDLVQLIQKVQGSSSLSDRTAYYLPAMSRRQAEEVMREAPRQAGVAPLADDHREALWSSLQHDETIDTVVLSIACHELFARASSAETAGELAARNVEDLLEAYLLRSVAAIEDPADRDDVLDMLREIAGSEDTRAFVTTSRLINAPLRDPARREQLLFRLQKAFLVRGDSVGPLREKVYDIMHERLLGAVRNLVARSPRIAAFREAAERIVQADVRDHVDWQHCCTLLANEERAFWDTASIGMLVRSVIREMSRDRSQQVVAIDRRNGDESRVESHPRDVLARLAARAANSVAPARHLRDRVRWISPDEVLARAAQYPDPVTDKLAIESALRTLPGVLRGAAATLALRLPT
jgi:hypothetical protein